MWAHRSQSVNLIIHSNFKSNSDNHQFLHTQHCDGNNINASSTNECETRHYTSLYENMEM